MNINRICLSGNLTKDPELKELQTGSKVCRMRLANNSRKKVGDEWVEKPNFFDVTVWGEQGERCARYLKKGSPVVVDGRMEWREYEVDGSKRQAYDVIATAVQFVGSGGGGGRRDDGWDAEYGATAPPSSGEASSEAEPVAAGAPAPTPTPDDDVPF